MKRTIDREGLPIQDLTQKRERAVLAGLSASSMDAEERSTEISMEELAALVDTAGADTAASRPTRAAFSARANCRK